MYITPRPMSVQRPIFVLILIWSLRRKMEGRAAQTRSVRMERAVCAVESVFRLEISRHQQLTSLSDDNVLDLGIRQAIPLSPNFPIALQWSANSYEQEHTYAGEKRSDPDECPHSSSHLERLDDPQQKKAD